MFENFEEKNQTQNKQTFNNFSLLGLSNNQIKKISADKRKKIAPPPPAISNLHQRVRKLEEKGRKRGKRNMLIGTIGGAIIALIVMTIIYFWTQDVYDISNKTEQDILQIQDLNNRSGKVKGVFLKKTKDDFDGDGLTNKEEKKYKTDPNNPDTDNDGFLDGQEVKNNFNPLGKGKL